MDPVESPGVVRPDLMNGSRRQLRLLYALGIVCEEI